MTTVLVATVLMTDPDTVRESYGYKWNGMLQ
jgi:hypothetical protein